MEVLGCEIEWGVVGNGVPKRVPGMGERTCVGEVRKVRLVPLGSSRLHVGELPTVDLGGGGKGNEGKGKEREGGKEGTPGEQDTLKDSRKEKEGVVVGEL